MQNPSGLILYVRTCITRIYIEEVQGAKCSTAALVAYLRDRWMRPDCTLFSTRGAFVAYALTAANHDWF